MTPLEKDALVDYLEFNLVKHCEQVEQHLDPDAVGNMYDSAYGILNEIDRSLQDIMEFAEQTTEKKKDS